MRFHDDGTSPDNDGRWVFVFGSNLSGHHGKGAAEVAADKFGARRSQAAGFTGQSYAIPTKGFRNSAPGVPAHLRYPVLPILSVRRSVERFLEFAAAAPDKQFFVTRVGAGLAGHTDAEMAAMFAGAPSNCSFARAWEPHLRPADRRVDGEAKVAGESEAGPAYQAAGGTAPLWTEMRRADIIGLPLWTPSQTLVHIGTLDPADKRMDSQEGHGLSVSECPESWEAIAKLGALPWWTLQPEGFVPRFLDVHKLLSHERLAIVNWAMAKGYCQACTVWRVEFHDEESDERRFYEFETQSKAKDELHALNDEHDGETPAPAMREVAGVRLTAEGLARVNRQHATASEAADLVAVICADEQTDLDGVYWGDRDEPALLSAPRAVIFPSRLARWKSECMKEAEETGRLDRSRAANPGIHARGG